MVHAPELGLSRAPEEDRWYATNGIVAMGPVSFDMLRRHVAMGQIPPSCFVRHESWKVWRALEDIDALSPSARRQAMDQLRAISAGAEQRATGPLSQPPPPPAHSQLVPKSSPESSQRASLRPVAVDPVGVLSCAFTFEEALLLTLSTAVTAAAGHAGLLHRFRPELDGAVTTFVQGPRAEQLLGEKLSLDDPSLLAAKAGHTVLSEFIPGEAARYMFGRMIRCLPNVCSACMVPFVKHGELVAVIEIGREWRPFRAREVARVEDIVDALAERVLYMGWLEP